MYSKPRLLFLLMTIFVVSPLVNVVTSLVIGILVFLTAPKNRTNLTFFLFALAVVFWSFAYFLWQISATADDALYWSHMLMAGAIWIPFFYFHFITRFLKIERSSRFLIGFGYGAALFFSVVNWTPLFIKGIGPLAGFPFWPSAGPLYLPFLVLWFVYAAYPVVLLVRRIKLAEAREVNQIYYILLGTAIGYLGGITNYFLWYGIPVLPYGNITASIYITFVSLAILRYRLFNMKVIAAELLVFSLWLFLFIRMLLAATFQDQVLDAVLFFLTLVIGVLLIRSVDHEVEARERIEEQEHELEAANRRQENLIHFISHEIKGYLTKSEAAFAAIVEGDFGAPPPDIKALSERALADVRSGVATVMDILSAGDFKKGTIAFTMDIFDLRAEVVVAQGPGLVGREPNRLQGSAVQVSGEQGTIGRLPALFI